jgi:ABC-type spermidine/putrescine transport system permease subunit II
MTNASTWIWRSFGGFVLFFMLTPLALVILFSFGNSAVTTFPMGGLSLKWYGELFSNIYFWGAFKNSLIVGSSVGITSTVVGTMAAMALARMHPRVALPTMMTMAAPIMVPPLVVGLALMVFYVSVGLKLSVFTVILSHLVFTQPFVILIVHARMIGFDYAAVESARDLGASPLRAFFTVTLPIVRPTIIGATFIAMALSLDDFIITFFTISGGNTLPTFIWGMIRTQTDPTINAIATMLVALTVGSSLVAMWVTKYRG